VIAVPARSPESEQNRKENDAGGDNRAQQKEEEEGGGGGGGRRDLVLAGIKRKCTRIFPASPETGRETQACEKHLRLASPSPLLDENKGLRTGVPGAAGGGGGGEGEWTTWCPITLVLPRWFSDSKTKGEN